MSKDEHKHLKVKTVTSLPIAFIDFIQAIRWVISLRSEAHATWRKILAAAIHEPAGWRIRHKNFRPNSHKSAWQQANER